MELHCGYVIGREKIITCAAGTYGFGDRSGLAVRYYDKSGFYLPQRGRSTPAGGQETTAAVDLSEGELAIILRL